MNPPLWVVIPSAGKGSRFGSGLPKQYHPLLGKTVLEQSIARFISRADVAGIVLAINANDFPLSLAALPSRVMVTEGGDDRAESVYKALRFLETLAAPDDLVAVHDAARPCVRQSSLDSLFEAARQSPDGAVLGLPATDTIKWADGSHVSNTLDRNHVWMAQTPQVFRVRLLRKALEEARRAGRLVTDESSAVEALGLRPVLVQGQRDNIKITLPEDLPLAAFFLAKLFGEND